MKISFIRGVAFFVLAVTACTSYQEEEGPVSFSVNREELSFAQTGGSQSLTVSSGTKWDVTSMPSWIRLQSIERSGRSPYEWSVDFSASANDEYNREGIITIKASTETAEISVTQEGKKGKYVAVESVSVSPTELTLTEGESASLSYVIYPSNASVKDVKWTSSSPSVATVSQTGRIDAVSEGTTLITVMTGDGNKTASCAVTVKAKVIPVTGISLNKTSLAMTEGDVQELVATVTPSNATDKSVSWTSSNSTVAMVSSTGVVTAKSVGSATITVKTSDGAKTATCTVTVKSKTVAVTGVSLDKTSITMTEGETQTIIATVTPSNASNKSVTWSSSSMSVVTISSSGVITAKSAGSATITVTTNDGGKKADCSVTVQVKTVSVTGVSLDRTNLSLTEGDTQTLTATVIPSNATNKSVSWSSSDTSVAAVSPSGVVTAKAVGNATITVTTSDGGKIATCFVNVMEKTVSVAGVTLDKTSLSLIEGDIYALTATVSPSNATNKSVTWSSSNTSVATVSGLGVVTAKAFGSANITVTTIDGGKTAICMITVKASTPSIPEPIDLGLSIKWASFNIGASKPEEYGGVFAWGETEPKEIYYWDTYQWCNGNGVSINKYCTNSSFGVNGFTDGKTVLDLADDVAYVKLGGAWRMPTASEIDELIEKCEWVEGDYNGISGWFIYGPNGNSIFIPAAGYRSQSDHYGAGSNGYYWSSSLRTDLPYGAFRLSLSMSSQTRDYGSRINGYSVRPVYGTPRVSVTGVSFDKTSLTMTVGDTQTLTATVTPSNATDKTLIWSSNNTTVATVSSSGLVTAKAEGSATVTVTTRDGGKTATCVVSVANSITPSGGLEDTYDDEFDF